MWAKVRDWWWLLGIVVALWFAWPEMRGWGIWTWIGFALAVAFALVVFAAFFHSGTISQAEDARKWECEQAREWARRMVELGICGNGGEDEAA